MKRCLTTREQGARPKQTKVYVGRKTEMPRYVAYFRVSTSRQGRSGLGLAAQRSKVEEFLSPGDELVAEFLEIESGGSDARTELWQAIAHAKKHQAMLLIAKLDRFSRRVSFIASIMEQGIRLVVAEMPHATDFQLHIFAALAQEERRLISDRTRSALREAKRRGIVLGKNGHSLGEANRRRAMEAANDLRPIVLPLLEAGNSYSAVARHLNERGIQPPRGQRFYPESVKNIALRLTATGAE